MPIIGPTNSVKRIYINSYFYKKNFRTGSSNTVNECQVNLAFFLLNMRYLFALLSLCRSLLRLKIVYVNCLLVTRASSYMAFMQFGKKIFKLHVSCAVPFIAFGRSENRRPPKTTADYRRPPQNAPQTTAGQTADHHRTWKIITNA